MIYMHRDTVIDVILVLVKEVEHRTENELRTLADIERKLTSLKDGES
jgi:hypothetical protein